MNCLQCDQPIQSLRAKKFCSTECRYNNQLKRYHETKGNPKIKLHKTNIECLNCNKIMEDVLPHRKFCNKKCKRQYVVKKYEVGKYSAIGISNSTIGAMHEMLVCADLLGKGYEVFKSISPHSSCDIAIIKDGNLLRVEVTTGQILSSSGKVCRPHKDFSRFDVLAVVLRNGKINYEPDFLNSNVKTE